MTSNSARAMAALVPDMPDHEADEHRPIQNASMPGYIVSSEEVSAALKFLRNSAQEIGAARAEMVRASNLLKHAEALCFLASEERSAEARKAKARTDERWLEAVNLEAIAVGEFEKLKSLREAASMKVETWRTEQATARSLR